MNQNEYFFSLLRAAMTGSAFTAEPTDDEWCQLFQTACRQSLVGLLFAVAGKAKMPMDVAMQWASEAEQIRGLNKLMNEEAARLTRAFGQQGVKTAILKGQANARLYPDPLSRQPGDIDIWVEGGRQHVMKLLQEMKLVQPLELFGKSRKASTSYHHVHLPPNANGVTVEVHFRPASGNFNPMTNRRLQRWLESEIQHSEQVEEGFMVPSVKFALVMQLAHIQRHLLSSGVGLRQVCDYFLLLRTATTIERTEVSALLKAFGLWHIGGALMWLLGNILGMDKTLMLCEPDTNRGEWLLCKIMEGGNFGHYSQHIRARSDITFFLKKEWRHLQMIPFAPTEMIWLELNYWKGLFKRLPERIRRRRLSLRDFPE